MLLRRCVAPHALTLLALLALVAGEECDAALPGDCEKHNNEDCDAALPGDCDAHSGSGSGSGSANPDHHVECDEALPGSCDPAPTPAPPRECPAECRGKSDDQSIPSLLKGINVITGDPAGTSKLFKDDSAYIIDGATEDLTEMGAEATSSYASVNTAVQREFGVSLSTSVAGRVGIKSLETRGTFSNSQVMKQARSATVGGSRWFSWGLRQYTMRKAHAELSSEILDDSFKDLVNALTAESPYAYYKQIFGNYGTHYINRADIGARVESYQQIEQCYAASQASSNLESCMKAGLEADASINLIAKEVGAGASRGYESCNARSAESQSESQSSTIIESYQILGGDPGMLSCGNPDDAWFRYTEESCLVLSNAEVFPTVLEGVWNLFNVAGNNDALVYERGEEFFYQYLLEQGEEIDPEASQGAAALCTPPPTSLDESSTPSALFLLPLLFGSVV
jgi:hypothetical protein